MKFAFPFLSPAAFGNMWAVTTVFRKWIRGQDLLWGCVKNKAVSLPKFPRKNYRLSYAVDVPNAHFYSLPFQQHLFYFSGQKMGFMHVRRQSGRGMNGRSSLCLYNTVPSLCVPIRKEGPKGISMGYQGTTAWGVVNHPCHIRKCRWLHAVHSSPFFSPLLFSISIKETHQDHSKTDSRA